MIERSCSFLKVEHSYKRMIGLQTIKLVVGIYRVNTDYCVFFILFHDANIAKDGDNTKSSAIMVIIPSILVEAIAPGL